MRLTVATFNIRNDTDRYDERRPLLVEAFRSLGAQVAALQEVRLEGDRQDDLLMRAAPSHAYRSFDARYLKWRDYGLATLVQADPGQVLAHETLELGHNRVVQRILLALPEMKTVWVANTHLHHRPHEPEVRAQQVQIITAWMSDAPAADAIIVAGDFNAPPTEPAYHAMSLAGYRSAHAEANGREPPVTWPSGIQASTMDTDGDPACLDYIWLRGDVRAASCRVAANLHAPADTTLYPSDHFALLAELEL